MGAIVEDRYDHEGYGARQLPDGTLTGVWSAETAKFEAYVASCGCGWHGGHHPPSQAGYESAVEEWEADHARPLLAKTVPAALTALIGDVKRNLSHLLAERPLAAIEALRGLASWADAAAARTQDAGRIRATQAALDRVPRRPAPPRRLGL